MPYSGAWRPSCQWPPCLQSTCPICPFQSFSRSHTFLTNSESGYIRHFFFREQQHLMYQHLVFTPRCWRTFLTLSNVRLSCRRHWLSCTAYQLLDWETQILLETTPWVTGNWSWSYGNTFSANVVFPKSHLSIKVKTPSAICDLSRVPFQYRGMYNITLNLECKINRGQTNSQRWKIILSTLFYVHCTLFYVASLVKLFQSHAFLEKVRRVSIKVRSETSQWVNDVNQGFEGGPVPSSVRKKEISNKALQGLAKPCDWYQVVYSTWKRIPINQYTIIDTQ